MCFSSPKMPAPAPPPPTPTIDDDAIRDRQRLEEERLRGQSGTSANIRSDLNPNDEEQTGRKRVALGV